MSAAVLPPHNVEAEEAVLGSLMIDAEALVQVADVLSAADFYVVRHGWIYEAIVSAGSAADLITVSAGLAGKGLLGEVGGESYLVALMALEATALNVRAYAGIVAEMAQRRRLLAAASAIAKQAYDLENPIQQVMEASEREVTAANGHGPQVGLVAIRQLANDFISGLEAAGQGVEARPVGIGTGWRGLDEIVGGLMPGDMMVIGARPAMGKTEMMLQMMFHQHQQQQIGVGVFSLEMSNLSLLQRMVASVSGQPLQAIRQNRLSEAALAEVIRAALGLSTFNIWMNDTAGITPVNLRMQARRLMARRPVQCLYVDYLQLMNGDGGRGRQGDRVAEVSYIARELKLTARELGVPIVVAAQLSRDVEKRQNKRPMASDLRESGAIEQEADQIVMLYRQDVYYKQGEAGYDMTMKDVTEVLVVKNRNGGTGEFHLKWDGQARRLMERAS